MERMRGVGGGSSWFSRLSPTYLLSNAFRRVFYYFLAVVFAMSFGRSAPAVIKEYRVEKKQIALEMEKLKLERLRIESELLDKKQKTTKTAA